MPTTKILKSGTKIGPLRIDHHLASGGFSEVYLARGDHDKYVLKVAADVSRSISKEDAENGRKGLYGGAFIKGKKDGHYTIENLLRNEINDMLDEEGKKLESIDSPMIVKPIDIFSFQERAVLVLPYIQGETLQEKMDNRYKTSNKYKTIDLSWFYMIALGLDKLKEKGFYHGDLKPTNIIITPTRSVKLIDPGLMLEGTTSILKITTPAYNPLLLDGERADLMAMGIMLYKMFGRTFPFKDVPFEYAGADLSNETNMLEMMYFISTVPMMMVNPKPNVIDRSIERIVCKCFNPTNDYNHKDFAGDLKEYATRFKK